MLRYTNVVTTTLDYASLQINAVLGHFMWHRMSKGQIGEFFSFFLI